MLFFFSKGAQKIGLNKTIAITVITRLIQALGGVVSIFFIARFLSPIEQGYYYTFISVIALQVFFELGLTGIITQYTAHEFAFVQKSESGLTGDTFHLSRLASLLRFCIKWFGLIAITAFIVLVVVGFVFFNKYNNQESDLSWKGPWIVLGFATALSLFMDPICAFFEGLGEMKDIAGIRLFQKTLFIVLLLLFFLLGFRLYAGPLASLFSILANYVQISRPKRLKILKMIWRIRGESIISYKNEILPLQWKIALSWLSGYLIFQLYNPVLFATEGAEVAGQMGITLAALNGISAISMSWIMTKIPVFSNYIALKQFSILDNVFYRTLKQLTFINLLGILSLIFGLLLLNRVYPEFRGRFLNNEPFFMLCLVTFVNQFVFSWATYLRCFKKEPYLLYSVVLGILNTIATLMLSKYWGLSGLVFGNTFLTLIVSLPWAYFIFKKKRIEFQSGLSQSLK